MACCCDKPLNVGCVRNCNALEFTSVAPTSGEYTLAFDFLGTEQNVTATFDAGDLLVFDITPINEHYNFQKVRLYAPDGTQLKFEKDSTIYDCLQLETVIGKRFNNQIDVIVS